MNETNQKLLAQLDGITTVYTAVTEFLVNYSFQIVGAVFILLIGLWASKRIADLVSKLLLKKQVDVTLTHFLANLSRIIVAALVVVIALGKFGLEITPLIAAIGALSLGAGLAFQGLLSNYVAGLTIIMTRPFVVGNTITINGMSGLVKEVKLAATLLETEDREIITIPNKHIIGEVLENSFAYRVVQISIGIAYREDPEKAIAVARAVLEKAEDIPDSPAPQVGVADFGDSSVRIGIRYWVPTDAYFETQYKINLAIYQAFRKENIEIPLPQREVKLLNQA